MKRLSDVVSLDGWCHGGCGLSAWRHRRGDLFLDVIHFADRRFNRRSAKRLLVLAARRERIDSGEFLNTAEWEWYYLYLDSIGAQDFAHMLGFRLPSRLFDRERARCEWLMAEGGVRVSKYERVRAWLRG